MEVREMAFLTIDEIYERAKAKRPIDEIYERARLRRELEDIWADEHLTTVEKAAMMRAAQGMDGGPVAEKILSERTAAQAGGPPEATVWKGLRRGTADTLEKKANVAAMNTAEIEHTRDNTALENIWANKALTTVEKAALMRSARGDGGMLASLLEDRAGMEGALRGAAEYTDPGEYAPRKTAFGRAAQAIVENLPYTIESLI